MRDDDGGVMIAGWFDRWRATSGWRGWLVLRWDVWQLRRFARAAVRLHRRGHP